MRTSTISKIALPAIVALLLLPTSRAQNQTAIDMLQPGDVIVADVFGAEWNFVGNKLAYYIQTTTGNGMIVDGGVYWLDRVAETGMQAYYKNSLPTQGMRVMVTGTQT